MAQRKQQNLREMANEIDRVIDSCLSTVLHMSSTAGIHLMISATEKFQRATNAVGRQSRAGKSVTLRGSKVPKAKQPKRLSA